MRNPTLGDTWKDQMFREHSKEFAEILCEKPAPPEFEVLKSYRPLPSSTKVALLDLMCGTGRHFHSLAQIASTVVGIDYSPELLTEAVKAARVLPNIILARVDARELTHVFPNSQFDIVVRAYTSLGYFPWDVELEILRQCAAVSTDEARILLDSLNSAWFRKKERFERRTPLTSFSLQESYSWNEAQGVINCNWQYDYGDGRVVDIPFDLEGYDLSRVRKLLAAAGWEIEGVYSDISDRKPILHDADSERIVVIGRRL